VSVICSNHIQLFIELFSHKIHTAVFGKLKIEIRVAYKTGKHNLVKMRTLYQLPKEYIGLAQFYYFSTSKGGNKRMFKLGSNSL